ncbi:MAG: hypothetical protein K8T25_08810 [Planctomycetia bacterium]|nr:hypothetical protein [Planctomycetia bacterium]
MSHRKLSLVDAWLANSRHRAAAILFAAVLAIAPAVAFSADSTPKPADPSASADKKPAADAPEKPEALAARIAELIAQLGDPQFVVRERAQSELQRIGPPALDALTTALENDDIEIAMRARFLLGSIKVEWTTDKDPARIKALLKNYDDLEEDGRGETIQELSRTGGAAEIEVLCRVIRYERSHALSKRAALLILGLPNPSGTETWDSRTALIMGGLANTHRTGAEWVRTQLRHRNDSAAALADWKRQVDAEQQTLVNSPRLTSREIVGELLRREVDMLEEVGQHDEAQKVMRQLVPLESGQEKSVTRLVEWLSQKKAWGAIDEVASRFGHTFEQNPMLMYTLAEARFAQGKEALAKEIAAKALALEGDELIVHLRVAYQLQERGLFRWAEPEFRRVIAIGPPGNEMVLQSYILLSEMHHDQGKEDEAGKAVEELVKLIDAQPALGQLLRQGGREPGSIRSRMYYFFSEQARLDGKTARQIELLDQAIANDATDADVLIAMYRLPNQTEARRQQTIRRIKTAADIYRREIQETPDSPTGYNQLAWLLGNSLGEADKAAAAEAIKASQKSLEIKPGSAGYLDTLARCYFASGDYEAAVRNQSEAVRLEPNSGLIKRQLEKFKTALAESKKKAAEKAKP